MSAQSHTAFSGEGGLFVNADSKALAMVRSSRWVVRIAIVLAFAFVLGPFFLIFAPWQQNIRGTGRVVAYAPLERQQQIEAPINGRIVRWWVREGSRVESGDPLLEISDIDPNLLTRLEQEKSALQGKFEAYGQKVQSYEAQVANLEATLDLAVAAATFRLETNKQKVRGERESLSAAEAAVVAAEAQFERKKNLITDGIVSKRETEARMRSTSSSSRRCISS